MRKNDFTILTYVLILIYAVDIHVFSLTVGHMYMFLYCSCSTNHCLTNDFVWSCLFKKLIIFWQILLQLVKINNCNCVLFSGWRWHQITISMLIHWPIECFTVNEKWFHHNLLSSLVCMQRKKATFTDRETSQKKLLVHCFTE